MEKKQEKQQLSDVGRIMHNSVTDPLGMYTGNPEDPYEVPVQDADDL